MPLKGLYSLSRPLYSPYKSYIMACIGLSRPMDVADRGSEGPLFARLSGPHNALNEVCLLHFLNSLMYLRHGQASYKIKITL